MKRLAFVDTEVYKNWSCIDFKVDGQHFTYEHTDANKIDKPKLQWFIQNATLVGFNIDGYDEIMILLMFNHASNQKMYEVSQRIIVQGERPWSIMKSENLPQNALDSIDIMPVLRGQASLKLYGARIHFHRLQELPIPFDKETTRADQLALMDYCANADVEVTEELYHNVKGEIDLRVNMSEMYGIDLRSKSGANIAETLLVKMCEKANNDTISKPVIGQDIPLEMRYQKPHWINFKTDKFKKILADIENDVFFLNPHTGHLILGSSVKDRIVYTEDGAGKMGIGGWHQIVCESARFSDGEYVIRESDFQSLYPNLIVNSQSYPSHFGPVFFDTYKEILSSRLADKKAGRKGDSEAKKLILNSSFGQFSNQYSKLYSPNLLLNTTLSGQLTLLMLIEQVEMQGFDIFSANTDSITLMLKRTRIDEYESLCRDFEKQTDLVLEHDDYKYYVTQNVNSYFAEYE